MVPKALMFVVPGFSLQGTVLSGLIYTHTQGGNNKQFSDHWFVMWTCDKLISVTLGMKNNHGTVRQIRFNTGFYPERESLMRLRRCQIFDFVLADFLLTVANS